MRIDKAQVLDILRSMGKQTTEAERDLPDQVDTDSDSELLGRYGLSGGDLLEQFGGAVGRVGDGVDRDFDGDSKDDSEGNDSGPTLPTGGLLGLRASGVQGGGGVG
ncbi:MAG: hypothetical protein ABIM89_11025 [Mycobacteriales bacterium]